MPLRQATLWACVTVVTPRAASAIPYEIFVDVETEEEIYDLRVDGQISEASFDALLLLHQSRVDLNRADRQALYRLPNLVYADVDRILGFRSSHGPIDDLATLVEAGVLDASLARSLAPFVTLRQRRPVHGFVRTQGRWSGRYDRLPPSMAVQARLQAAGGLDAGLVAVLARNRLTALRWDARRQAFSVEPERVRLLAKAYVEWESDRWEVVGGTYRIGFGQRVTFDVTGQATPNGIVGDFELARRDELQLRCRRGRGELAASPCPTAPVARVTPDFTWTNRLTGIAAGVKRAPLGSGWIQAYSWGSAQVHRVLRSEVFDRRQCADPRHDDRPECNAPPVFVRDGDPSAASATATYATLPSANLEPLAGGHVSYFWSARVHLGATGYWAIPRWRVSGVALDYQESARRPFGGAFGAVGVEAAAGFARQDFFAELTRSFDRQRGGGGGVGLLVRSVTRIRDGELDASLRYYASRFANPYARPLSASDELDGLRARDEMGVRVRGAWRLRSRVNGRVLVDVWRRLSSGVLGAVARARIDVPLGAGWAWSWWVDERGPPRRTLLATRVAYAPSARVSISAQLQARRLRVRSGPSWQHDVAAILLLAASPLDRLRLRFRGRYDVEDVRDDARLPRTVWVYAEAATMLGDRHSVRARYDVRAFLDDRPSTALRAPNPEHWLWLEYVARF